MKKQRTFISVEIAPEKKAAFVERLEKEGKTVTGAILGFIESYLNDENSEKIEIKDLKDVKKRLEVLEQNYENAARLVGESSA